MHNPLSKEERQVVFGTLMGDGYLKMSKGDRHARFVTSASLAHEDYIMWKWKMLQAVCPSEPKLYNNFLKGTYFPTYQLWTHSHSFFTRLRNLMYPEGKKIVKGRILNDLGPLGLAVWFMDDGQMTISGYVKNKNGQRIPRGRYVVFNIQNFTPHDCDVIQRWFLETYNIRTRLQYDCSVRNSATVKLCIGAVDAYHILRPIVAEYVSEIPSMNHKIDFKYSNKDYEPPKLGMYHYKPDHSAQEVITAFQEQQ